MKKLLLLTMMLVASIGSYAQKPQKVFCELIGTDKLFSSKIVPKAVVTVNFGKDTSFWAEYANQYLVDEDGKAIRFDSMVDAMNFMSKLGWEFEQAYTITTNNQHVYHWLLSNEIVDGNEQTEGIKTKKMHNSEN